MKAGELDQRITIQNYVTARGTSGEQLQTWQTWQTVWAQVLTTGGSEAFYSPQLVAEATHKIKMRYIALVDPDIRLLWRNKILEIVYVDESRIRQGELFLLCREKVTP